MDWDGGKECVVVFSQDGAEKGRYENLIVLNEALILCCNGFSAILEDSGSLKIDAVLGDIPRSGAKSPCRDESLGRGFKGAIVGVLPGEEDLGVVEVSVGAGKHGSSRVAPYVELIFRAGAAVFLIGLIPPCGI